MALSEFSLSDHCLPHNAGCGVSITVYSGGGYNSWKEVRYESVSQPDYSDTEGSFQNLRI